MKYFNTAGPIKPERHYFIPVAQRIQLDEIKMLIEQEKYFVLHAPRQSGKTTALLEVMRLLNASGRYKCLYVNVEAAQTTREDVGKGMAVITDLLVESEKTYLSDDRIIADCVARSKERSDLSALSRILADWARQSPLPTVLLIDEIDSLIGDTLVSVLRQLRGGYAARPKDFPQSVILCGVRDIRDYRIHASSEKEMVTGGSCFNVNAESLNVGNFSAFEVRTLYQQHTDATGQVFTPEAVALAYELTRGQPWLVNALAYQACFKIDAGKNRQNPITDDLIRQAKEELIVGRVTHLDQLADKLQEPRVRRIIEPMVRGETYGKLPSDDIQYCLDLGLLTEREGTLEISNPIYQEVIPRELTHAVQLGFPREIGTRAFVAADGSLDVNKLLTEFQQFFRENSESWVERFEYAEAGPQLLLQAYLQRVINGGGRIYREYGLGRGRTDLLVEWPAGKQRVVIELKIQHKTRKQTTEQGLAQTLAYMEQSNTSDGHLIIFDRTLKKPWSKKIYRKAHQLKGKKITVWGM